MEGDQTVSKEEFDWLMKNPDVHVILKNFGVDGKDLLKMKEVLFEEQYDPNSTSARSMPTERSIPFEEFLDIVMRMRGGNASSVHDVAELRSYLCQRMDHLEDRLEAQSSITPSATTKSASSLSLGDAVGKDGKVLVQRGSSGGAVCRIDQFAASPPKLGAEPEARASAPEVRPAPSGKSFEDAVMEKLEQMAAGQQTLFSKVQELSQKQDHLQKRLDGIFPEDALLHSLKSTSAGAAAEFAPVHSC
jgi:hypothetical protein